MTLPIEADLAGHAATPAMPRRRKRDIPGDLFLVTIALSLLLEVEVVGRLLASDILLLVICPFLMLKRGSLLRRPDVKITLVLMVMWLLAQIATDMVRGTPSQDYLRGWSKIFFFSVSFISIYLLVNLDRRRIILLIAALAVCSAIKLWFGSQEFARDIWGVAWRFGYGQAFTLLVFLIAVPLGKVPATRSLAIGLTYLAAPINLVLGGRNLFGIAAVAATIAALTSGRRRKISAGQVLLLLGVVAVMGWMAIAAYSYAASSGLLGPAAEEKYQAQLGTGRGVLLGGRTESLVSVKAISDSPIIGHGSWARNVDYVIYYLAQLEAAGLHVSAAQLENDVIPSHSHLLGAWVEAGIMGAVFWSWIVVLALRSLYAGIRNPTPTTGVLAFVCLSLLWDIFFSPFGAERRVLIAAWICLMIIARGAANAPVSEVRRVPAIKAWRGR